MFFLGFHRKFKKTLCFSIVWRRAKGLTKRNENGRTLLFRCCRGPADTRRRETRAVAGCVRGCGFLGLWLPQVGAVARDWEASRSDLEASWPPVQLPEQMRSSHIYVQLGGLPSRCLMKIEETK